VVEVTVVVFVAVTCSIEADKLGLDTVRFIAKSCAAAERVFLCVFFADFAVESEILIFD
jgi:hypothetical protein